MGIQITDYRSTIVISLQEEAMLRVNVGLSRKLSKDYNSTGCSVNLDGEVTAPVSDPEALIEQVKELFDLAEEALSIQIEQSHSIDVIASHDQGARQPQPAGRTDKGSARTGPNTPRQRRTTGNGNGREQQPVQQRGRHPLALEHLIPVAEGQIARDQQLLLPPLNERHHPIGRPVVGIVASVVGP
jgi:hypothetical protein